MEAGVTSSKLIIPSDHGNLVFLESELWYCYYVWAIVDYPRRNPWESWDLRIFFEKPGKVLELMTQMSWKIRKSSGKSCIFFLWQPWKTWFSVLKLPLLGQTLHFIGCWHYLINTAMKFISESPINFRMLSVILICLRVMSRIFQSANVDFS